MNVPEDISPLPEPAIDLSSSHSVVNALLSIPTDVSDEAIHTEHNTDSCTINYISGSNNIHNISREDNNEILIKILNIFNTRLYK